MASTDIAAVKFDISGLGRHAAMPELTAEDTARLNYNMAFSRHMREQVEPKNKTIFDARVEPAFVRKNGRKPKDRHEVRKAMLEDNAYQWWACLRRHQQELGSATKWPMIERQADALIAKAKVKNPKYGSLKLDPSLQPPRYQAGFDMHWMAGSYHGEGTPDDVLPGAMYDLGGLYMGSGGKFGKWNDGPGHSVVHWLKTHHPDFRPKKVLDEGCTVGQSTGAYCGAWPGNEVHGVDYAAPILRYGFARAQALKLPIHFKQALAEDTGYADNSFDLVVSSMFLHETSHKAVHAIVKEAHRILKPGGLMLHVEQPPFAMMNSAWQQFVMDWDTHNNNEPFWGPMHDMELEDVAVKGGFKSKDVVQTMAPFVIPQDNGKAVPAAKGEWFFFCAWKR